MAPLYLAAASNGKTYTHPLFRTRLIRNQTPAWLSECDTVGLPLIRETAYGGYLSNIDAFIAATVLKTRISCDFPFYDLFTKFAKSTIQVDDPSVAFAMPQVMTEAQRSAFLSGMKKICDAKIEKRGKTYVCIAEFIKNKDNFFTIIKRVGGRALPRNADQEMTPNAYRSLCILDSLITSFLQTHTYPAYSGKKITANIIYPIRKQGVQYKTVKDGVPSYVCSSEYLAKMTNDKADTITAEEMNQLLAVQDVSCIAPGELVAVAKPSPIPANHNIGGPADVPVDDGGLVFPYFEGMITGDYSVIKSIITTHFFRLFGKDADTCKAGLDNFLSGIQEVARFPMTCVYAHILFGVRLALLTQSRLMVMQTDEYNGFVLVGAGYSIRHLGEWKDPVFGDEFRADLSTLSDHDSSVESICRILSNVVTTGEMTEEVDAEAVGANSGRLWMELQKRKLNEEQKRELEPFLRRLRYPGSYIPITPANIAEWCTRIRPMGTTAVPGLTDHVYIPPTLKNLGSWNFYELCKFGPDGPSFINISGERVVLDKDIKKVFEDENGQSGADKSWKSLVVHVKGVYAAHADLDKMLKEKVIMFARGERAKTYRNFEFTEGVNVELILDGLIHVAHMMEDAKGKRKAHTNEGEAGPSKKPRVEPEGDLDDMDALFSF